MNRLLVAAMLSAVTLGAYAKLPFIDDDYAAAFAKAKSRNVPIFIETWAPW